MASVVNKLLNIAQATNAYFGEKDYQQLTIIKRMVADLNHPTRIIGVPIVREDDGLAMSSRNARLTSADRAAAPVIYKGIMAAQEAVAKGVTDPIDLKKIVMEFIKKEPRAEIITADIVDEGTLAPITEIIRPAALLLNVAFNGIILIDQSILMPKNLVP
ncbi:UNVERIFIED_CONTAM: hypothetical protein GTU68_055669 [Idotea baltica]|nr:hypothetical protein [Idotea baltica]